VELDDPLVRQRGWRSIVSRPVTLGAIADTVEKIVRER